MSIILIYLGIVIFSALPSLFILWLPNVWLRDRKLPYIKLTLTTVLLALVTGFILNLELESGFLSLPIQLISLDLAWAFISMFTFFIYTRLNRAENT